MKPKSKMRLPLIVQKLIAALSSDGRTDPVLDIAQLDGAEFEERAAKLLLAERERAISLRQQGIDAEEAEAERAAEAGEDEPIPEGTFVARPGSKWPWMRTGLVWWHPTEVGLTAEVTYDPQSNWFTRVDLSDPAWLALDVEAYLARMRGEQPKRMNPILVREFFGR